MATIYQQRLQVGTSSLVEITFVYADRSTLGMANTWHAGDF